MARTLAASANNGAYTLTYYIVHKSIQASQEQHTLTSSRMKIVIAELKEDSNTVGFTLSSDDGGGEEVVNEIWTPIAEATRKGIFNRLMVLC